MTQLQLISLLAAVNTALIYWLNQHTELPGSLPSWARAALLLVLGTVVDPGLELWRAGSTFAEAFVPGLIAAAPAALLLLLDTWAGVRTKVKAAARTAAKVAAGSLVLLVTGCAGSLEESRGSLMVQQVAGVPVRATPSERCDTLDGRYVTFGAVAIGAGSLSAATGLTSIPVKNDEAKTVLVGASVGLAAVGASAAFVSQSAATRWSAECVSP